MTLPPTTPDQPMTAEQIVQDVANDKLSYRELGIAIKQYAQSVAQAALNDAAENATVECMDYDRYMVDTASITSTEIKTP